ncbi:hypothetical protein BYT27DRAFT_7336599 [Phlegmacium glaucopus]|nr:hypothetical protein BYT27DRAFT_7336599 [Phlegmacium glaucopus]
MSMELQATENEWGSPVKFYRFQKAYCGTTYHHKFGFLAGDSDYDIFPSLDHDEQRSIVENHAIWSCKQPSPFISTTSDLEWAQRVANGIMSRSNDPIHIAEISPGRALSGSMHYYDWDKLVFELDASIEYKAMNDHETVFLGHIPAEAITWYGTVQESEEHCFEDEEEDDLDEDYEQEQYEYSTGDGPPFATLSQNINDNPDDIDYLVNLTSKLEIDGHWQDSEEGEEDAEEAEGEEVEWHNFLEADLMGYRLYPRFAEEEGVDLHGASHRFGYLSRQVFGDVWDGYDDDPYE